MSITTQGCRLEIGDTASPIVYTAIDKVTDFQGFSGSRSVIDTTCLASTGREKSTGIPDFGQVNFNIIYDGDFSTHLDLHDLFESGLARTFRIVFDDSPEEVFTFTAYVLTLQYSASIDDVVRAAVTLEVSGSPTDNN